MPEQAGSPRSGMVGGASRLGLLAAVVLGVGGTSVAAPAVAHAEETPPTVAGAPAEGRTLCTLTDPRLPELSGLVVVGDRMLAVNDGGAEVAVHVLDRTCTVTHVRTAPVDPFDPEDLAVSADGTIWIADTGDNAANRSTVALHALRADGSHALYRLSYPDGPHDAEALLVAPDGTPFLVTKEVLGASKVYRPVSDLAADATVGLEEVAVVTMTLTGTPGGPVGRAGQLLVTGGAVSGNGRLLALRTYTDAYVWSLSGSDVPGALAADPVRVPLPDSPQGEAISFDSDDRGLVVAGEGLPSDVVMVSTEAAPAPVAAAPASDDGATHFGDLGDLGAARSPITSAIIAAAFATVVVWIGGLLTRRRS